MSVFSRRLLVTCTALGVGFMAGQPAQAHGIESSLRYLDGQLELSSSFSTGEPVEGAAVRLINADGTPGDELGEIGANGQLVLTLPDLVEGVLDLQVDGRPGHRHYSTEYSSPQIHLKPDSPSLNTLPSSNIIPFS